MKELCNVHSNGHTQGSVVVVIILKMSRDILVESTWWIARTLINMFILLYPTMCGFIRPVNLRTIGKHYSPLLICHLHNVARRTVKRMREKLSRW